VTLLLLAADVVDGTVGGSVEGIVVEGGVEFSSFELGFSTWGLEFST
jgi:hypothetical protein